MIRFAKLSVRAGWARRSRFYVGRKRGKKTSGPFPDYKVKDDGSGLAEGMEYVFENKGKISEE
jgi:hypothetical protein